MEIRVDRRTVHFERDDQALAEVAERRARWLEQELELARLFCRIDRKAAFCPAGCSSIQQLASLRGYHHLHARDLCRLGYALDAEPELEALLRDNEIGFAAACALGRILEDPALQEPDDEWIRWARLERLSDLTRRILRRIESVRQGRPANVEWTAHVTTRTAENLARCRQIAARKAGVMLTNGQLLDVLSTGYLLDNDPLAEAGPAEEGAAQPAGDVSAEAGPAEAGPAEAGPAEAGPGGNGKVPPEKTDPAPQRHGLGSGTRRLPPTSERPGDRTIPAEVARALEERSGGRCEFGGCDRPATESCHLVPHARGSGREVHDLVRGCRLHHKSFDAGLIRFLGWTRSSDELGAGLPTFLAVETNTLLRPPGPWPAPRRVDAAPPWLLRALGARHRKRLERLQGGARQPPAKARKTPPNERGPPGGTGP